MGNKILAIPHLIGISMFSLLDELQSSPTYVCRDEDFPYGIVREMFYVSSKMV
jgi:hypothetical protein